MEDFRYRPKDLQRRQRRGNFSTAFNFDAILYLIIGGPSETHTLGLFLIPENELALRNIEASTDLGLYTPHCVTPRTLKAKEAQESQKEFFAETPGEFFELAKRLGIVKNEF